MSDRDYNVTTRKLREAFQRGEQVYRTTYKGMNFLLTYNRTIELITNVEKENDSSCLLN